MSFVLGMDLRSFNQLVEAIDRNRRAELREDLVLHVHAAQGSSDSVKKFMKSLDMADDPNTVVATDQKAFMAKMGSLR